MKLFDPIRWLDRIYPSYIIYGGGASGGQGGGGHGGGGGQPGGGSGNAYVPFTENGGFQATQYLLFVPTQSVNGGPAYISTFLPNDWNDPTDGSSYSYRMEDVIVGRVPTVRRLFVVYRDLGLATVTFTVSGTNDNAQVVSQSQTKTLGNPNPTGALLSAFFDIALSAYRPQVSHSRAAGSGPLSIVSVTIIGEVEDTSL